MCMTQVYLQSDCWRCCFTILWWIFTFECEGTMLGDASVFYFLFLYFYKKFLFLFWGLWYQKSERLSLVGDNTWTVKQFSITDEWLTGIENCFTVLICKFLMFNIFIIAVKKFRVNKNIFLAWIAIFFIAFFMTFFSYFFFFFFLTAFYCLVTKGIDRIYSHDWGYFCLGVCCCFI